MPEAFRLLTQGSQASAIGSAKEVPLVALPMAPPPRPTGLFVGISEILERHLEGHFKGHPEGHSIVEIIYGQDGETY